jgi:hypothetical protein
VKPKRPFSVTLLFLGVLSIAGLHLLRLLQAVQQWQYLDSLPGVSPALPGAHRAGMGWGWRCSAAAFGLAWAWAPGLPWQLPCPMPLHLDRPYFAANVSLDVYEGFAWPFRLMRPLSC